ncbi:MAG: PAS domain-containing protein, partial [Myxococcota bacterium]
MNEHTTDLAEQIAQLKHDKARLTHEIEALQTRLDQQESQSQVFALMLHEAPVAMVMIDADMNIQLANAQAQSLMEINPDRDTSAPLFNHVHPDDQASLRFACEQALAGKVALDVEIRTIHGDRVMLARAAQMVGGRFLLTLLDITVHLEAEHERRRRDHQAHQARMLRALGLLAGSVAHDINNVLGAITAMTGCILQELGPEQRGLRADITSIQEAAVRGRETTDSLNTIARPPQTNPTPLQPPEEHLEHMVQLLNRTTTNAVRITTHFNASSAQVNSDQSTLAQMFASLLAHAVESALSEVQITTRIEHDDDDSDWLVITITDDSPPVDDPSLLYLHDPSLV